MKKLLLHRPEEKINKYCPYEILIDDKKVAELHRGESISLELPAGVMHDNIKARIYWCGSKRLKLKELKKEKSICVTGDSCLNQKFPIIASLITLIGLAIGSGETAGFKYAGIVLILMMITGLIGTMTLWRDRWITFNIDGIGLGDRYHFNC